MGNSVEATMLKCEICGMELDEERIADICPYCGVTIGMERKCIHCDKALGKAKFCPDCGAKTVECGQFKDERDGQVYRTVKIGGQIWMAENLNYGKMSRKFPLKGEKKWCYGFDENNCRGGRGGLYSYTVAKRICPKGWHLPSEEEWKRLFAAVGGMDRAGRTLMATGDGTYYHDPFGFSVLLTGYVHRAMGEVYFTDVNEAACFWCKSKGLFKDGPFEGKIVCFVVAENSVDFLRAFNVCGYSVRCVKD